MVPHNIALEYALRATAQSHNLTINKRGTASEDVLLTIK